LDPEEHKKKAANMLNLPPEKDPTEGQIKIARIEMTREAFKPFHNPLLCSRLMEIRKSYK